MSKHIKNLELFYDSRPQFIAHQRQAKVDDSKGKPQDLNFWKIFSKVPRAHSLKQNQDKQDDNPNLQEQRLIVISAFKNTVANSESPTKNFRVYKHQIKRYISDQGINFVRKVYKVQHSSQKQEQKSSCCSPVQNSSQQLANPSAIALSDEQPRSADLTLKRTIVSGNNSEMKSKYRINKDLSKKSKMGMRVTSKIRLPELKEEKRYPLLMKNPDQLKQVKSQSYILLEYPSQRVIVSNRSVVSLEIASLTKIMTFYTVWAIAEERKIDIKAEIVTVTPEVNNIGGTSAELIEGEKYTVEQLLYGLMLPSGNDAANQLAYWAGSFFTNSSEPKALLKAFVLEMNRCARILQLKNSKFANAHGLPHQQARSTASDIARLCCICMKIDLFRTIVGCKLFRTTVKNETTARQVEWQNTNKLLRRQGFLGIKTGITVTAGPCLAAAYNFRDKTYISVILRAPKVSGRFRQTRLLLHWSLTKLFKDLTDAERNSLKKLKKHDHDLDSDYSEDEHQFRYDCGDAGEYKRRINILTYEI